MDLHNEHKMTELLEIFRQRPVMISLFYIMLQRLTRPN